MPLFNNAGFNSSDFRAYVELCLEELGIVPESYSLEDRAFHVKYRNFFGERGAISGWFALSHSKLTFEGFDFYSPLDGAIVTFDICQRYVDTINKHLIENL